MITIKIPSEGPLYLALWRYRKVDEPLPKAAVRALEERFVSKPIKGSAVQGRPLLSYVEVIDG